MRKKIALITPMLQPYRVSFYEKLNRSLPNVEWTIFHGVKRTEDGRPNYAGETSFNNSGHIEVKTKIGPYTILVHRDLFKAVKKYDPDMIIIQSITGNLSYRRIVNWAALHNKKIINWTCGWEPGRAKGLLLSIKNFFVSSFYRKGNPMFLTYSTKAVNYVAQKGINRDKIAVCYNGIEIDDMLMNQKEIVARSEVVKKELQLGEQDIVFLYVGGLLEDKKVDLLIDAFHFIGQKFKNIRLIIIGDGPLKQKILQKIKSREDKRVTYLGRIIEGVDPYFVASSCLVLPGAGGLAINQAMFWKKICIAGEADGTEDDLVLEGKTGFRFEKNNLLDLVRAMENVIKLNKSQLNEMGERAREIIVTKSNVNNMVKVFSDTVLKSFPELENNTRNKIQIPHLTKVPVLLNKVR